MTALKILFIVLCIVVAPYIIAGFLFGLEIMLGAWADLTYKDSEETTP